MVCHADECLVSYSIAIPALCLASAAGTISAVFDPQTAAFPKDIPSQSGLWINESPMPPWGTSLAHSLLTSWIIMEDGRIKHTWMACRQSQARTCRREAAMRRHVPCQEL